MPENVTGRTADWLNCAESCLRFTSAVEAREFWVGLSLARAVLKLTIGLVFLFLDCYEFQNVLRKLEYSDVDLAEMVRDTERPCFSWQGCAWGLPRGAAGACQSFMPSDTSTVLSPSYKYKSKSAESRRSRHVPVCSQNAHYSAPHTSLFLVAALWDAISWIPLFYRWGKWTEGLHGMPKVTDLWVTDTAKGLFPEQGFWLPCCLAWYPGESRFQI